MFLTLMFFSLSLLLPLSLKSINISSGKEFKIFFEKNTLHITPGSFSFFLQRYECFLGHDALSKALGEQQETAISEGQDIKDCQKACGKARLPRGHWSDPGSNPDSTM